MAAFKEEVAPHPKEADAHQDTQSEVRKLSDDLLKAFFSQRPATIALQRTRGETRQDCGRPCSGCTSGSKVASCRRD